MPERDDSLLTIVAQQGVVYFVFILLFLFCSYFYFSLFPLSFPLSILLPLLLLPLLQNRTLSRKIFFLPGSEPLLILSFYFRDTY